MEPGQFKISVRKCQEELKANAGASLDHFRIMNDKGEIITRDDEPCYASFACFRNGYYGENDGEAKADFNPSVFMTWHTEVKHEAQFAQYLRWAIERSPYAAAFKTKTAKEVVAMPTVMGTDFDARYLIGAAMLIRYRREYPQILKMWCRLKRYMTEDMAFIFAHYLSGDAKYLNHVPKAEGHILYDTYATPESVARWLMHKPAFDIKKNTVHDGHYDYHGLWRVWGVNSAKCIKFPAGNDVIKRQTWGGIQEFPVYSWKKMDKLLQEFIDLNNLKEAYEYSVAQSIRRRR